MVCLSLLAGIGLAHTGRTVSLATCEILGLLTVMFWRLRSPVTLLLVICLGLSLGVWRGAAFMHKLADYQSYQYQKVTLSVRALNDAVYSKNSQLTFDADHILLEDGTQLTGKLQVSGFGENAIFQDDALLVTGKLYPGFGASQERVSFA
jgi:hypothetical protein